MRYVFIMQLLFCQPMLFAQDSLQYNFNQPLDFIKLDKTYSNGLGYSIYLPSGTGVFPLVLFVNGVGNDVRAWHQYQHWPRAVLGKGMAAIVYEARIGEAYENSKALLDLIVQGKADERIDHQHLVLWMCSSNSEVGQRLLMDHAYPQIKGASLYYPSLTGKTQFRPGIKIELVKAGLDSYSLNRHIDNWLQEALKQDADVRFINFPGGRHAFDMYDDELPQTSQIISGTLQFMKEMATGTATASAPKYTVQGLINLMEENKPDAASAYYHAAINAAPPDGANKFFNGFFRSASLQAIAGYFMERNQPGTALLALQWALEREPQHPENHLLISRMYESNGDIALAKLHAAKARELFPAFGHPDKNYLSNLQQQIEAQWNKYQ